MQYITTIFLLLFFILSDFNSHYVLFYNIHLYYIILILIFVGSMPEHWNPGQNNPAHRKAGIKTRENHPIANII